MTVDEGLTVDATGLGQAVRELLEDLQETRERWFLPVLLMLVRDGLDSLRFYLEAGEKQERHGIAWWEPLVAMAWPVPWDWDRWEAEGPGWYGPTPEGLVRRAEEAGAAGDVEALADAVLDFVVLEVLQSLTALYVTDTHEYPYALVHTPDAAAEVALMPPGLVEELGLERMTKEEEEAVLAELYAPFTFNRDGLNRLDPALTEAVALNVVKSAWPKDRGGKAEGGPRKVLDPETRARMKEVSKEVLTLLEDPLRLTLRDEGREREVSIRLIVQPLMVSPATRDAFFPTAVGIVDPETGHGADLHLLSDEAKAALWTKAFEALDLYEGTPAENELESILRAHMERRKARGKVKTGPPARYLLDGPTRIDRGALALVGHMEKVTLPRKWSSVRRWEELVEEERTRLQDEHGDEAFQATDQRGPLLLKKTVLEGTKGAKSFREVVELSKEAEDGLLEGLAGRPFRRVLKDEDGRHREFLIKRVRVAGGGTLEVRLSWYDSAWRLVDSAREDQRNELEDSRRRFEGSLFEDLDPKEREALDNALQHMQAVRDGRAVMECILSTFGRDGRNPVEVAAWTLRTLLECEKDPNGLQRVRGCLRALQELRYSMKAVGTGTPFRSFGPFLANVDYDPRGAGGHGDGVFYLQVAEPFVGALKVFAANHRIKDARRVLVYEWTKDLTRDEKKTLGEEGYVQGFSALGAFFDRAKGFTDHQSRLRRWIEHELTLNRDATKTGRSGLRVTRGEDAKRPRAYDTYFCPLLPEGRAFFGALGHFKHNPESGRTLYGGGSAATPTSGAKTEGLMAVMGHEVPSGRSGPKRQKVLKAALQDLRAVVEEALGGVVAACHGGRWFTLEEAVRLLPEPELGKKARWFLFVAEDWNQRYHKALEDYHEARRALGETDHVVRVTKDREVYRKSEEALRGVRHEPAAPDELPLHHRLLAARRDRGLSQEAVGKLFGVSKMAVSKWEAGPLADEAGKVRGKPIPEELVPLVRRWIEGGTPPTAAELAGRRTRRTGRRPTKAERGGS